MYDLARVAEAYGAKPGDPNWDEACDINRDGIVDGADHIMACGNYRKTC